MHYQLIQIDGKEENLPKESGRYTVKYKNGYTGEPLYDGNGDRATKVYWINHVHSYYAPVEVENWVSVEERLPDYDDPVLWISADGNMYVEALDKDGNDWLSGSQVEGFNLAPVTHWRTLPAPHSSPNKQ